MPSSINGVYYQNGLLVDFYGNPIDLRYAIRGNSYTPFGALGPGAGSTASFSINGTDLGGVITINSGTSPVALSSVLTVTYSSKFINGTSVIIKPANLAASNLPEVYGTSDVYASGDIIGFTIFSGHSPMRASTTYIWNYMVVGY